MWELRIHTLCLHDGRGRVHNHPGYVHDRRVYKGEGYMHDGRVHNPPGYVHDCRVYSHFRQGDYPKVNSTVSCVFILCIVLYFSSSR